MPEPGPLRISPHMPINDLVRTIHSLDRDHCKAELLCFDCPNLDFTEQYLEQMSTERLRHVLMAACLQARKGRQNRSAG